MKAAEIRFGELQDVSKFLSTTNDCEIEQWQIISALLNVIERQSVFYSEQKQANKTQSIVNEDNVTRIDRIEKYLGDVSEFLSTTPDDVSEKCDSRERQLEEALRTLVDLYVKNQGSKNEVITCITPKPARDMSFTERRESKCWRAFDNARDLLGYE